MTVTTTTRTAPAVHTTTGALTATAIVAKRTLVNFVRTPQLIVVGTVQGAMFLLIFRYVFGGAISSSTGGLSYVNFLVPGYVVTGVLFSGTAAAAGVAEDLQHGVVDRLRSLPIPRPSVASGRAVAETLLVAWGAAITTAIGFLVGFRPAGSVAESLIAFALVIVYGFTFTWVFIVIGLLAGSAQAAQGLSLLVFPFTFVSSAYVPVETMPSWMQPFARHQPITYMVDSVRAWVVGEPELILGHPAGYYTVRALLWCVGIVAVFAPIAVARYRSS